MKNFIRKTTAFVLVLLMMAASTLSVIAAPEQELELIPIRAAFEEAGADVNWDSETRSITVNFEGDTFVLFVGSQAAYVNDERVTLQNNVVIENGTAFINNADLQYILMRAAGLEAGAHLGETIMTANQLVPMLMDAFSVPGAVVAIVDTREGFSWVQGFGYADTYQGIPVDGNTIFGMASVAKPFTAITVMQLVEDGVICLDEPIVTYLPDFYLAADFATGTGDYRNITARMLLSHTSGIYPNFIGYGSTTVNEPNPAFMDDFLQILSGSRMPFPEGTTYLYNNSAFNLLGVLVAEKAGHDDVFTGFSSHVRQNIFEPLEMSRSTFILEENHMAYLAMPYVNADTRADKIFWNGLASGGLYSNAYDMMRFMNAILCGEVGGILAPETLAQMFVTQDIYGNEFARIANMRPGLGFFESTSNDGFSNWGHGGNVPHYHTGMAFDFETGIGVFISTNSTTGISLPALSTQLLATAIFETTGALDLPSSDMTVVPIEHEELEIFAGLYLFISSSVFTRVYVEGGVLHMYDELQGLSVLQPLSDGSFADTETGTRFWFVEVEDGEFAIFQGAFKASRTGDRLNLEEIMASESFAAWTGVYYPVTEGNEVSFMNRITVIINDYGIAYSYIENSLMGLNTIAPMVRIAENIYGNLEFFTDGNEAWFYLGGMRFVRAEVN